MIDGTRILIVDDEPGVRVILNDLLSESYDCSEAASAADALVLLKAKRFDLVLCDIRMPGMSGLDLIPLALECSPEIIVVMVSGEGSIESAIGALRAGAYDYVKKPFNAEEVEAVVRRALDHRELLAAKRRYEQDLERLVEERTSERDRLVYYDALTGLPNRVLFEYRLTRALNRPERGNSTLAVAVYSVDRLRAINETLGYVNGDETLRVVAGRLSAAVSEDDCVARWGGNEFAVLLTRVRVAEDVAATAREISDSLKAPLNAGGHELTVSVSAGVSVYPQDGGDAHGLLRNAVAALRRAKEQGGGVYQFYTAEMNAKTLRRLTLESGLRRAVEGGELSLHYQPQVDTDTGRVLGLEALARWEHKEHGMIPPAEFIPLAEETGLIISLGEWVLRRACSQVKSWQDEGLHPPPVAVNLSGRQFRRGDLPELVSRVLNETGLQPSRLRLELTESCVMEDAGFAAGVLGELKAKGVGLSIDDFGTGYSSLSYLKRLPVDELKIDRSFVNDATNNEDAAAIVAAIILLARTLRLQVVAEGVETEAQLELLRTLACERAQGFLFSRPLPAEEVRELLPREGSE